MAFLCNSKGIFVAADSNWLKQTATVYYYDNHGRVRTTSLTYDP
jgi:hypothetical protein